MMVALKLLVSLLLCSVDFSVSQAQCVLCFADPCSMASCPAYPDAACRYCEDCTAHFYLNGEEIPSESCTSPTLPPPSPLTTLPPPTPSARCPEAVGGGGFGTCISNCDKDSDCSADQLCCSNACGGRVCVQNSGCRPEQCPVYQCLPGYVPTTLPGDCCATCQLLPTASPATPTPPCSAPCPIPLCLPGYVLTTLPGDCCATCQLMPTSSPATPTPLDCTLIQCAWPQCEDGALPVTLPGHCCPSCPEPSTATTPLNCAAVACLRPTCADQAEPEVPPGECCPQCPTVDCSLVRCAYPTCGDGATPMIPPGECCLRCPPSECSARIYPVDFIPVCLVAIPRWTFDFQEGCTAIAYSPCGQEQEGYNVFEDELGCQQRCGAFVSNTTTPAPIRPDPLYAALCPALDAGSAGLCVESCSSDQACTEGLKCCSNGCGHSCVAPEHIPYYPLPEECPPPQLFNSTVCPRQPSCTDSSVCADNQLCCQRGTCGRYCTPAVNSSQPCSTLRSLLMSGLNAGGIPGAYIPTCQDDGSFAAVQFHGSTGLSWCVDVHTGYPVTPFSPRGVTPQCPGVCTDSVSGRSYVLGQRFNASDGCNTCVCTAEGIRCTEQACTCSLPPSPGPCRAAIPAYHYDSNSGTCRQFVYGGCGGNANKFRTVRDCLTHCAPSDRCLQPKVIGVCDALFPSYFFNSSSGMCEQFNYGGCGGNENRFSSGLECLQACSPDTPPSVCWSVRCGRPECAEGEELVTDSQHCCPYCRRSCRSDELQCSDGQCIPAEYFCDGLQDCPNGEDENNCPAGNCDFMCGDGHCIDASHVCDSVLDCADHSDANNCSQSLSAVQYLQPSDIVRECPRASDLLCADTTCSGHEQCSEGEMCCATECGNTCVSGIPQQPLCHAIAQRSQGEGLIGAFQPSCQPDGSFSELQCHGSTGFCWCVDVMSGQPVSNGTRGFQNCSRCRTATGSVPVGTNFNSADNCNTCKCTKEFGVVCTKLPCVTESCEVGDMSVAHNEVYRDKCSSCVCVSGRLSCNRSTCPISSGEKLMVNMTYTGDHHLITNNKTEITREIKRTLLSAYTEIGLHQKQVDKIDLFKGSLIVTVTFQSSNTSGANLTLLLSQIRQDYMSGDLVIRYNGLVLEPTGTFQSSQQTNPQSSGLLWWHYLLICVSGLIVILVTATVMIIVVVAAKNRKMSETSSHAHVNKENEYMLSFNKDQDEVLINN